MGRQEKLWNTKEEVDYRYSCYEIFKQYLNILPKTLLDIGCGFAHEAGWFNTEHGTDIWLLDKNRKDENHKDKRHNNFGPIDNFEPYNSFHSIRSSLKSRGCVDFQLLEPFDIKWNDAPTFDIIMSISSMGFHYPVDTYKHFIAEHSHEDTKIFCSLRNVKQCGDLIKNIVFMHRDQESGFPELNTKKLHEIESKKRL